MPFTPLLITDRLERICKLATSSVVASLANMDCADHERYKCTTLPNRYCYSNCASYREVCVRVACFFVLREICGSSFSAPGIQILMVAGQDI